MITLILPDIAEEDLLLAKARSGDQGAIMQIYERYFTPLYQFVRLRTDDSALAEDIAGEVFLKLVSALSGKTAPRDSLRGWLFSVARHELARHYGRNKRYAVTTLEDWEPIPSDDPDLEAYYMRQISVERARKALRMLAPDQQEVLILRFGQALNLEETADVMGKSVSAIKSLQSRAVNTLRGILGKAAESDDSHG